MKLDLRISVVGSLASAKYVTKLPKHVASYTGSSKAGLLPRNFDTVIYRVAILLEQARFVGSHAHPTVLLDPVRRPRRRVDAPALGIHMEGTEVEG